MRGKAARQAMMLTAATPDALVPQDHPIRRIKPMVDRALALGAIGGVSGGGVRLSCRPAGALAPTLSATVTPATC